MRTYSSLINSSGNCYEHYLEEKLWSLTYFQTSRCIIVKYVLHQKLFRTLHNIETDNNLLITFIYVVNMSLPYSKLLYHVRHMHFSHFFYLGLSPTMILNHCFWLQRFLLTNGNILNSSISWWCRIYKRYLAEYSFLMFCDVMDTFTVSSHIIGIFLNINIPLLFT